MKSLCLLVILLASYCLSAYGQINLSDAISGSGVTVASFDQTAHVLPTDVQAQDQEWTLPPIVAAAIDSYYNRPSFNDRFAGKYVTVTGGRTVQLQNQEMMELPRNTRVQQAVLTSKTLFLGIAEWNTGSLPQRYIKTYNIHPSRGGFQETSEIKLDPFEESVAVGGLIPQTFFEINHNGNKLIALKNSSCAVIMNFTNNTWEVASVANSPSSDEIWSAVTFSRDVDTLAAIGGVQNSFSANTAMSSSVFRTLTLKNNVWTVGRAQQRETLVALKPIQGMTMKLLNSTKMATCVKQQDKVSAWIDSQFFLGAVNFISNCDPSTFFSLPKHLFGLQHNFVTGAPLNQTQDGDMLVYPGYIPPFSLPGFSTGTYGIAQLRDTPTKIPDLPLLIPTRLRPLFYTPHSSLTMSAGMDYIVIAYSVKENTIVVEILPSHPAGMERDFQNVGGSSRPCRPGFIKPTDKDISPCVPCPPGTYQPSAGATECLPCHGISYCPMGTARPRPWASLGTPSTKLTFPLTASLSLQQRMLTTVFDPTDNADQPFTLRFKPFWLLLGLIFTAIVFVSLLAILRALDKCITPIRWILKADIYKEPSLNVNEMAIVDRGSVVGLFITLCGIAVAIVLVVYAVSFYDDYKLFTISQASDAVGSNNDNTMKVIPMGFDRVGDNIVQDLRVNLTYIINMRLLDYRPPNVAREQCSDLRGRLFVSVSGCYDHSGNPCLFDVTKVQLDNSTYTDDCVFTGQISPPHVLETPLLIQVKLPQRGCYFTAIDITITTACPLESCSIEVSPFTLSRSFFTLSNQNQTFLGPKLQLPMLSTYVIREVEDITRSTSKHAFASLITASWTKSANVGIRDWILDTSQTLEIRMEIAESTYWLSQTAKRTAQKADLLAMVVLTAVTIVSVSKLATKLTTKLNEKIHNCINRLRVAKLRKSAHQAYMERGELDQSPPNAYRKLERGKLEEFDSSSDL